MIVSPDRKAQVFASVFAEANSSKKPDIRPEQMSGAISGHSLGIRNQVWGEDAYRGQWTRNADASLECFWNT